MIKWWRHPLEALRWWWHAYDEPDWRTRLLKPFLLVAKDPVLASWTQNGVLETWEYKWVEKREKGWEVMSVREFHPAKGQVNAILVRRRVK